jgi:hypothetical protein
MTFDMVLAIAIWVQGCEQRHLHQPDALPRPMTESPEPAHPSDMNDVELLAAYVEASKDPDHPVVLSLLAELEWRGLDPSSSWKM